MTSFPGEIQHNIETRRLTMSGIFSGPRVSPFLWFDQNALEAAQFYVSIFPNSRMLGEMKSDLDNPNLPPKGKPIVVSFELDGQKVTAMNGGPHQKLTPAFSFVVSCKDQAEIDDYWSKLSAGGAEVACGWLTDKFGLSWQIVPANIGELVSHPKGMQAMMGMVKLNIAELEAAARD
jgi:predicted 3-demethylubiquinone-9 3-methyltransferase (glyoxalase superfamily)